jgi:DNA-binding GntR family transcriptional regulator
MRTAFNPKYPEQMQEEHRRYISLLEQRKGDDLARHLEENLRRHVGSIPASGNGNP